MIDVLTSRETRAAEIAAIQSGRTTGAELMERAGYAVIEAIYEQWQDFVLRSGRAVVLAGPGNNGGDGFVVARLLAARGWRVEVFLYGDPDRATGDAAANQARWQRDGGKTHALNDFADDHAWANAARAAGEGADLVVDAVFGIGLTRPVTGALANLLSDPQLSPVVAVDGPSGLCLDSGRVLTGGQAVRADLTVTFHAPKPGHLLADGPDHCGSLTVRDIGLESGAGTARLVGGLPCNRAPDADAMRRALAKTTGAHKFGHGHALVLSGPAGHTGAARLAARGALRAGAGLVTLGVPPSAQMEAAAHLTAIMLARVPDADALAERLEDARITSICLGPGMGVGGGTRDMVAVALQASPVGGKRAVLLDADAITSFAEDPEVLFALCQTGRAVMTPHGGEFARIFPDIANRMTGDAPTGPAYSRIDAARDAAARSGAVMLLKGPDTILAHPDGRVRISAAVYDAAAPWLATAGAGDVLSGIIAGLLARGQARLDAATTGAWLHGQAARHFGPGLIAEDLPEMLPSVFRELGL